VLLNDFVHIGRGGLDALPGPLPALGPAISGVAIGLLLWLREPAGGLVGGTGVPALRDDEGRPPKDPTMAPVRALGAAITLAGGNSLGPEGPSVEIGANLAAVVGSSVFRDPEDDSPSGRREAAELRLNCLAAGCASGIAAGFNAPVSGVFFALESVRVGSGSPLGPAMQLIAAVLAATVAQLGLGSSPAVNLDRVMTQWEPQDSLWELPAFLLLGLVCGTVAACLQLLGKFADRGFEWLQQRGVPKFVFPVIAGLCVTVISMNGLEEVVYRGFENVNLVLLEVDGELRPPGAPEEGSSDQLGHLLGLLVSKVILTAICRSSGQVGGLFAPSLFMGATIGGIFGRGLRDYAWSLPLALGTFTPFSVPATYAVAGMAACMASICGVPLTAVVLLLELAGGVSYGVVLPTVAAVGVAIYVEDLLTNDTRITGSPPGSNQNLFEALFGTVETIMEAAALRGPSPLTGASKQSSVEGTAPEEGKDMVAEGDEQLPSRLQVCSAVAKAYVAVQSQISLPDLWRRVRLRRARRIVVLSADTTMPLGFINVDALLTLVKGADQEKTKTWTTLGDLVGPSGSPASLESPAAVVDGSLPLPAARELLETGGRDALLFVTGSTMGRKRLLGVASMDDLRQAVDLERAEAESSSVLPTGI